MNLYLLIKERYKLFMIRHDLDVFGGYCINYGCLERTPLFKREDQCMNCMISEIKDRFDYLDKYGK